MLHLGNVRVCLKLDAQGFAVFANEVGASSNNPPRFRTDATTHLEGNRGRGLLPAASNVQDANNGRVRSFRHATIRRLFHAITNPRCALAPLSTDETQ